MYRYLLSLRQHFPLQELPHPKRTAAHLQRSSGVPHVPRRRSLPGQHSPVWKAAHRARICPARSSYPHLRLLHPSASGLKKRRGYCSTVSSGIRRHLFLPACSGPARRYSFPFRGSGLRNRLPDPCAGSHRPHSPSAWFPLRLHPPPRGLLSQPSQGR